VACEVCFNGTVKRSQARLSEGQGVSITDEEVALLSPLAYAHVIPNGTYFFDRLGEGEARTEQKRLK